jgi:GTPase Era involved in 16S rRNA processing
MARSQETWGGTDLLRGVDAARRLARIVAECGLNEEANRLNEAVESAQSTRFVIGVVGRTNRGKSTLINGILGRRDDQLAPVERAPATNVVTCFASSDKEEAWVVSSPDGEPRRAVPISFAQIKSYACEEHNPDNAKGVTRIEVLGPFSRLPLNVVLVDTPGSHNALSANHGEALLDYLPRLDAVIFLISADAPLVDAELDLLANIRNSDIGKIFFTINKIDKVDPDELAEGEAHNRKVLSSLGLGAVELFSISAKQFWQTGVDSGVESLLEAINRLVNDEKGDVIARKLNAMTERLRAAAQAACVEQLALCRKTDEELDAEVTAIKAVQSQLISGRPARERRFRRLWSESVVAFEDALPGVRSQVLTECRRIIDGTNSLQLSALGQTLHTTIAKKLDDALQPHLERMRSEIDAAARSLEVDFTMQLKSLDGTGEQVSTKTTATQSAITTVSAGVMPSIAAVVCTQIPGWVATAITTAAPTVATAVWWNPLTWVMCAGTGVAAGSATVAAGVAGSLLAPVAAIGTPVLLGYAGYKIATTWVARNAQTRDELAMATRDKIEQLVGELRATASRLKRKDDDILAQFNEMLESQIESHRLTLQEYSERRPSPEQIEHLQRSVHLLAQQPQLGQATSTAMPEPLF